MGGDRRTARLVGRWPGLVAGLLVGLGGAVAGSPRVGALAAMVGYFGGKTVESLHRTVER